MDAQAYLMRHGWSGPGNPLNPNQRPGPHGGLGLTKPILVARKANNHGVGKKTTKDPTNQWWLRGFEDALKGMGEEKSTASATSGNALTSELYRFFVRGEGLAGTLDEKKIVSTNDSSMSNPKRKRDAEENDAERRLRKEEKAARKEERRKRRKLKEDDKVVTGSVPLSSGEALGSEKREETKAERRLRRNDKKKEKEKESRKVDVGVQDTKKGKKYQRFVENNPTPMSTEQEVSADSSKSDDNSSALKEKQKKVKKDKREGKPSKKPSETKLDSKKTKMGKKAKD